MKNKRELLLEKLKEISAQIGKAGITGQSQLKLKSQFAKVNREYKILWLRDFKKGQKLHDVYAGRIIAK